MRGRSSAALRAVVLLASATAVTGGWIAFRSSSVLVEQVEQADRTGGSIEFSPMLWAGELGGFLVGAVALAVAIFAGVGLRPLAQSRARSHPGIPIVAAAVLVVLGLVAGPFAFPLFVAAATGLLVLAARRYWARARAS